MTIVEAKDPKLRVRVLDQDAYDDSDVRALLAMVNEESRRPDSLTKFTYVASDIYACQWLPGMHFFFAVRDDKIVAFIEYSKRSTRKGRGFRIEHLGVDPAYRDQGLAAKLCTAVLNMGTVYSTPQTPGGVAMTMNMLKAGQTILAFDSKGKLPDVVISDPAQYIKLARELPSTYEFASVDDRKKTWW